ncbi:DUF6124 family protein [Pseudomonas huanghezhanensis]|uniref:DUF6124 family protein n=1 Tax=Pseudomonas huanghezhanensis TaxID=3002903 RepID=UPI00228544C3|nr:hypothetical protein [Pseudomonas sp. BSw22131]
MIRSTPHPPKPTPPKVTCTNANLGNLSLFSVRPGVRAEDALLTASEYLACATATAYEVADNSTPEFRPLARSVLHQLEAARALIEVSIAGLSGSAGSGEVR